MIPSDRVAQENARALGHLASKYNLEMCIHTYIYVYLYVFVYYITHYVNTFCIAKPETLEMIPSKHTPPDCI